MIYEIGKLEAQIKVIQLEGEFSIRKILGDDLFFQFKGILEKLKKQAIKKKYTIKNKQIKFKYIKRKKKINIKIFRIVNGFDRFIT